LLPDRRGYTGFLIEGPSEVCFPGDAAYTPLFREYGERFAIDVAVLPIGAYQPTSFRRVPDPEDLGGPSRPTRAIFGADPLGTFARASGGPPRWNRSGSLKNRVGNPSSRCSTMAKGVHSRPDSLALARRFPLLGGWLGLVP
jgi:hypothetical protein